MVNDKEKVINNFSNKFLIHSTKLANKITYANILKDFFRVTIFFGITANGLRAELVATWQPRFLHYRKRK